jgi:hypothetical protein
MHFMSESYRLQQARFTFELQLEQTSQVSCRTQVGLDLCFTHVGTMFQADVQPQCQTARAHTLTTGRLHHRCVHVLRSSTTDAFDGSPRTRDAGSGVTGTHDATHCARSRLIYVPYRASMYMVSMVCNVWSVLQRPRRPELATSLLF